MTKVVEPDEAEPLEAIPVASRREGLLAVVAAWTVLFLVIAVAGWFVWDQLIRPDGGSLVSRYADGDTGETYESVEDQLSVVLPSRWRRNLQASPLGEIARIESTPGSGYLFAVTRTPMPETALESYKQTLNEAARSFADTHRAEIVSQTPAIPFNDVGLEEIVMRKGDRWWRVRFVLATDRLYTLEARTPDDDDGPFKRLTESFVVLGPR